MTPVANGPGLASNNKEVIDRVVEFTCSMSIGLCMVVKDEAHQITQCLDDIVDCFGQRVFVDTGSSDGTRELIKRRYGDSAMQVDLDKSQCHCLSDPRLVGLENLDTPWVMFLDADERVEPEVFDRVRLERLPSRVGGLFGNWINHINNEAAFPDYKLFLFRNGLQPIGLIHDNVQMDIRRRGLSAEWHEDLNVHHYPDPLRTTDKDTRYRQRLRCAIALNPEFYRYHWFQGYMDFRAGNDAAAIESLTRVAHSNSTDFPVECLNSHMVLADIYSRQGQADAVERILSLTNSFYERVAHDFEVRINFRVPAWLDEARRLLGIGDLDSIRAYRFAC